MLAFARGFFEVRGGGPSSGRLAAKDLVTVREGRDWGAVFLLELDGGAGLSSNPRPSNCIFADLVVSVVAPSDEALVDVLARIEAFDDTIADLVPMRVDSTIFPSVELPLADSGAGEYECATGDFIAAEPLVLDKLGGAYALVRAHLENLERPPSELHGMLKFEAARSQALGDALGAFASHVYRLVRPSVGEADDLRIFVAAACSLLTASTARGLDATSFVRGLAIGDGEGAVSIAAFLTVMEKVFDNRIELVDGMVDDSGGIGQRALLIFLLAPTPEKLRRWVKARTVGPRVALLASVLSGLYAGFGGLSRGEKGASREQAVAHVAAARLSINGEVEGLELTSAWDQSGVRTETLFAASLPLMRGKGATDLQKRAVLEALAGNGSQPAVAPESGDIRVVVEGCPMVAVIKYARSSLVLGGVEVYEVVVEGRQPRRGALTRDVLERLLDESSRPVVACLTPIKGRVLLRVEVQSASHLVEALNAIGAVSSALSLTAV